MRVGGGLHVDTLPPLLALPRRQFGTLELFRALRNRRPGACLRSVPFRAAAASPRPNVKFYLISNDQMRGNCKVAKGDRAIRANGMLGSRHATQSSLASLLRLLPEPELPLAGRHAKRQGASAHNTEDACR